MNLATQRIYSGAQCISSEASSGSVTLVAESCYDQIKVTLTEDQWNQFAKETDEAYYGDSLPSSDAIDTDSMSREELVKALYAKQSALYATWEALESLKPIAEEDGFDLHRTLREVRFALKAGREVKS